MNKSITIPDEDLRSLFSGVKRAGRGQYLTNCPFCNKPDHFYINKTTQLWDCKRCSEEGNVIKLLKHLDKLFLLGEFKSVTRGKVKLLGELFSDEVDEEIDLNPKARKLPVGFERLKKDLYWNNRGFTNYDFKKYKIGKTDLVGKMKNYSIISVEEDGRCVGYLSRVKMSKAEIKEAEKAGQKVIRYRNDKGAKFSNLLLGIDEITKETKTIILLEGFPDKVTLDRLFKLDQQQEMKCCVTFGKKISRNQVLKLLAKGIENIILVFDYDAIKEMKKQGAILQEYFNQVLIGFTMNGDINDSTDEEVFDMFSKLKTVADFKRKTVKTLF